MKVGLVSDVHGNLPALEQVLRALEAAEVEHVVCLGDLVGYNADPNECVARIEAAGISSVAGNHDLIAVGKLGTERCADRPAFTLRQTRKDVSATTRAVLDALPARLALDERTVAIHGGFDDPSEYLFAERKILANRARMIEEAPTAQLCLFGHTHEQAAWDLVGGSVVRHDTSHTVTLGARDHAWFVNPGSVDASRKDGVRLAEFAIFDTSASTIAFHRMPYDDVEVERRARAHGYRMTRADELLYAAARWGRRGRSAVWKRLRKLVP